MKSGQIFFCSLDPDIDYFALYCDTHTRTSLNKPDLAEAAKALIQTCLTPPLTETGKALIQTCLNSPDPPPPNRNPDERMSQTGYEETELAYPVNPDEQEPEKVSRYIAWR